MSKHSKGIVFQIKQVIDSMCHFGESKFIAKHSDEGIRDKVYSWETRRTYIKQTNHFIKWCKAQGYTHKSISEYECHVSDYLRDMVERYEKGTISASTIKTRASALGKVYHRPTTDFGVVLPLRKRVEIVRSRQTAVRDSHFSERKHADFVTLCKSSGLRRCELERLTGDQYKVIGGVEYITDVTGKGGKVRNVELLPNNGVVRKLCADSHGGRVVKNVYKNADIHGYRGEYATAMYNKYKRPLSVCRADKFYNKEHYNGHGVRKGGYDQDSVYVYRDGSGRWLDKRAMLIVSQALGHERISVVASNYLYNVDDRLPK